VDAVSKRYVEHPPADRRALDEAWAAGMGDVSKRFPDDLDAATLYAESLMDLQPWDLWTADGKPKGRAEEIVATLESVLKRDPQHPGANHYYIHAVEASQAPGRATASADRLRDQNLTGAGHLVHMPSHIYVRTGRYSDATEANAKAVAADEAYIQKWNPEGPYASMYYPHNVHFRAWAASMEGRSAESIENARKVAGFLTPEMMGHMPMLEGIAGSLEFVLVRFGHWDEVLALPEPPANLRFQTAMWHWARGIAFAETKRIPEAQAESKALGAILAETPADRIATQVNTGKRLLTVASEDLAGTIAARRGRTNDAVKHLKNAIAAEDQLVYMEPPDWFAPLRPYLGAVLLDGGRAKEAEDVYREDLRRNPENGWALAGLAKALEKQGKTADAVAVRTRFEKAWARADVTPSLAPRTAQGAESPTVSVR
jgi:tetratricopeptide (TPR) repeat protein